MRGNRKAAPLGTQSLGSSSFPARACERVGVYVSGCSLLSLPSTSSSDGTTVKPHVEGSSASINLGP